MKNVGITHGFQWINGSFAEDVEEIRKRPPSDVDIVTFAHRPITHRSLSAWKSLVDNNMDLFDPVRAKADYHCDAYFVDLDLPVEKVIDRTRYWFGLFGHQKVTGIWKGLIQVPLLSDDFVSRKLLP